MFGLSHLFYPWGFLVQAFAIVHFLRRRPEGYWFTSSSSLGWLGAAVYDCGVFPGFGLDDLEARGRPPARHRLTS